jgi:hypothetical protein
LAGPLNGQGNGQINGQINSHLDAGLKNAPRVNAFLMGE